MIEARDVTFELVIEARDVTFELVIEAREVEELQRLSAGLVLPCRISTELADSRLGAISVVKGVVREQINCRESVGSQLGTTSAGVVY